MTDQRFDLIIRNVRLVRPHQTESPVCDIGVLGGRIAAVEPDLVVPDGVRVIDGSGQLAFPGLVDAHMHVGIYAPLADDARTESRAAAMGGVTTSLNYMRTGKYYLNKTGPYAEFFPEVRATSEGQFHVDYAYHLAPMDRRHISEIESLIDDHGVTSFKIFMFYGGYGLHGSSSDQKSFLMIGDDERYDIAHFEFVMRGLSQAIARRPHLRDCISLSLHCETAEIMTAYTKLVQDAGTLSGLRAYSASRPPHSEGLAIVIASYLAHETELPNINLLHLTSRKAVEAALMMRSTFPHVDFRREVTIGHLLLDYDAAAGAKAKVNPPIRSREDVEYLWEALLRGDIDWVCSDHACCAAEHKASSTHPEDIFVARSGFGGTEYLLSGLFSEGTRRGLPWHRIAELTSWTPAQRFGLYGKGDIAPGYDADLVLLDPSQAFVVDGRTSESTQGYSVFDGMTFTGTVTRTLLRGVVVYDRGAFPASPGGQFLKRPYRAEVRQDAPR
jgi:allantoinase